MAARRLIVSDLHFGSGEDLDVRQRTVIFGHTHVALDGFCTPDGRHRLYNSGSWVRDGGRRAPNSAPAVWPRRVGTVLRATGPELELRGLLDDSTKPTSPRCCASRGGDWPPRERRVRTAPATTLGLLSLTAER